MHAERPISPAIARLLDACETIARHGEKPTVDRLTAACGGSRSTAQEALQRFWSERLPDLLQRADRLADGLPESVRDSMRALWSAAIEAATSQTEARLADREASIEAERQALEDERQAAQARIDAAERLAEVASARLEELREQLDAILKDRDRLGDALAASQAENVRLRAELAEASASLRIAKDDLARVREELGKACAALEQARKEMEQERQAHAAKLKHLEQANAEAMHAAAERLAATEQRQASMLAVALAEARQQHAAAIQQQATEHKQAMDALRDGFLAAQQRLMVDLDAARTEIRNLRRAYEAALRGRAARRRKGQPETTP